MDIVKYIICAAVVVLILAGFVIGMIRNRKIRRNGIEAQGVISRVEERYESDGESGSIPLSIMSAIPHARERRLKQDSEK